jgi:hypothetical protein
MSEKLTKFEWEEKIASYHKTTYGVSFEQADIKTWWQPQTDSTSMRLTLLGLHYFEQAGIEFHKYEGDIQYWTGSIIIGLSHMLVPFYLESTTTTRPIHFKLYLADDEYAMLLMLMDNDIETFAKGFKK